MWLREVVIASLLFLVSLGYMFWAILMLLVCGGLLVFSSQVLVTQSRWLAKLLGVSEVFIGLTVVALGTSLPELVVSIMAILENDASLAAGQIIGSNISNSTLIFGIAVMIGSLKLKSQRIQNDTLLLLLITVVYIFVTFGVFRDTTAGGLLIGAGIGVTLFGYFQSVGGHEHEEETLIDELSTLRKNERISLKFTLLKLLAAVILMGTSGQLLVINAQFLSVYLNLSTTVVGLTLISLITSLPELVTTIVAARSSQSRMALGNIVGSNIYNLAVIGGLIALNGGVKDVKIIDLAFLAVATISLVLPVRIWKKRNVPEAYGVVGIILYVFFIMSTYLAR